jgi:hypothetical protein
MDAESYSPDHREQENRDGEAMPNPNKVSPRLTEDAALALVKSP